MSNHLRYQRGTVEKISTSDGLCYYLRYFERLPDGTKRRVRARVGLAVNFKTKRDLDRALEPLRSRINSPAAVESQKTMSDVIARYRLEEMPQRHSTRRGYDKMLRRYIEARWGSESIRTMDAADVRLWLKSLAIAPRYRGHIHGLMRVLFRFALLWRWIEGDNPMQRFRMEESQTRTREPRVLTREEFHSLLAKIARPLFCRMALIAALTGLRCSELAALKWSDIRWIEGKIRIERAVVEFHVGDVKTKQSGKPIPMGTAVAAIFSSIRSDSAFQDETDWVFANPRRGGKRPYDTRYIQTKIIRPAVTAAGLGEHIGWHTFRHSYKTWLDENGVELTVQRDLMRHADIRTTAQVYGAVRIERLRKANDELVEGILQ